MWIVTVILLLIIILLDVIRRFLLEPNTQPHQVLMKSVATLATANPAEANNNDAEIASYRLRELYDQGFLSIETLKRETPRLLSALSRFDEYLCRIAKPGEYASRHSDQYLCVRDVEITLILLLEKLKDSESREALQTTLTNPDPVVQCYGVMSLLKRKETVPPEPLGTVAAWPEMRNTLYDFLEEIGRADLYPEKYRTQLAFAESDMVIWLIFPTELAVVPDEIELVKVVTVDDAKEGTLDYYVFRFRMLPPHPLAQDGWEFGVSGPYRRHEQPTTHGLGKTFSSFASWNDKTPEQIVEDMRKPDNE